MKLSFWNFSVSVIQNYARYKHKCVFREGSSLQKWGGGETLPIKKDCVMIKGGSVRAMTEKEGLQPLRSGGNEK